MFTPPLQHLLPNDLETNDHKCIRHVFLKVLFLNILFLNKAPCTTWVSGALAASGFFVRSFLAWIQCFPHFSPYSWFPHIHEDVTSSEKPYKLYIS